MAKQLNQVELTVRGPAGGPYKTFFQGVVGSTDDPELKKPVVKTLEDPDLTKSIETFMADELSSLKSDEGIA